MNARRCLSASRVISLAGSGGIGRLLARATAPAVTLAGGNAEQHNRVPRRRFAGIPKGVNENVYGDRR